MNYKGIQLDLDWTPDKDIPIDQLPSCAGIYAEIHWESCGVRIGHAKNIRNRHRESSNWSRAMHSGTASPSQLKRNNVFCQAAKRDGRFAHCVVSIDPSLNDKTLRLEVEAFLFDWVAKHPVFQDFNYQRGWKNTLPYTTLDEAIQRAAICQVADFQ